MAKQARRRQRRSDHRGLVRVTAALVLLSQAVLLGWMFLAPDQLPADALLWELLWAKQRAAWLSLLLFVLIAGPALTLLAWSVRGRHRQALVLGWLMFAALGIVFHAARLDVMLRVLWWRFGP